MELRFYGYLSEYGMSNGEEVTWGRPSKRNKGVCNYVVGGRIWKSSTKANSLSLIQKEEERKKEEYPKTSAKPNTKFYNAVVDTTLE